MKRVFRDVSRHDLPQFRVLADEFGVGLEIGLRIRRPLKNIGRDVTVADAKTAVRSGTEACLRAVKKRLPEAIGRFKAS